MMSKHGEGARKGKPRELKRAPERGPVGHGRRGAGGAREVAVLYEDEAVAALDKPAGLLAVPIKGSATPSALSLLSDALKMKGQRAQVVHRIDRFTSGILLFAKTRADREALVRQFLEHRPQRQYVAVVRGKVKAASGTLVHYFRREGMHQQLRRPGDPNAARAELRYRVERNFAEGATMVRVELVTGFQNQIRAQFAAIGHPVIGDRKYSPAEASEKLIDRVALHAARLQFEHPRSGERVTIECPLPVDIQRLVRGLEQKR